VRPCRFGIERRYETGPLATMRVLVELEPRAGGGTNLAYIHEGPCLAVTLNERLDYFGSTVNAAARIVGLSGGHDVVVSRTVRDDPEVAAKLADGEIETEPIEAVLKGFDDASFELWRVRRAG